MQTRAAARAERRISHPLLPKYAHPCEKTPTLSVRRVNFSLNNSNCKCILHEFYCDVKCNFTFGHLKIGGISCIVLSWCNKLYFTLPGAYTPFLCVRTGISAKKTTLPHGKKSAFRRTRYCAPGLSGTGILWHRPATCRQAAGKEENQP